MNKYPDYQPATEYALMSPMDDDLDSLEPISVAAERPAPGAAGAPPSTWPEGWYADPWTAGQYRYWNGRAWTGATHRWGPANAPAAGAVTQAWPVPATGYGVPAMPSPPSEPDAGPRRRAAVVAAIVALVAVLVASGAIGYAINANSHSDSTVQVTPPTTAPAPTTTVPGAIVSRDPDRQVLGRLGLRHTDVSGDHNVFLYAKGNTLQDPTLDLCNATFPSERLRTARLQLVDVDPAGDASLSTEAVLYRSPAAAAQAFTEIRKARADCPSTPVRSPVDGTMEQTKFEAKPDGSWRDTSNVERLAYRMVTTANGQSRPLVTVYLRRGRALLGLYFPAPNGAQPAVAGQSSIESIDSVFEARMAALSPKVVDRTVP
jgi:hypothetical protein